VRDPRDAIPSIMLENGRAKSFNFRRLHILRARGVDIADYRTALDRAVASLVHWYDLVMALSPEAVIRVEDAESAVRDYLWQANLPRSESGFALTSAEGDEARSDATTREKVSDRDVLIDDVLIDADAAPGLAINSAMTIFGRSKPDLSPDAYDVLDLELRERLVAYCDRFGYGYPWRPVGI
jgi:hypothetical protein